jgi:hypothetical protein
MVKYVNEGTVPTVEDLNGETAVEA